MRILFLLLFGWLSVFSQSNSVVIEVGETKFTQVIFMSDVQDKELGHEHYQFQESTSSVPNNKIIRIQYFGVEEEYTFPSNLQVVTVDGNVYDLSITNAKNPKKTTYVITSKDAITNLNGEIAKVSPQKKKKNLDNVEAEQAYTHYSDKEDVPEASENYDPQKDKLYVTDKKKYMSLVAESLNKTKAQYSRFKSVALSQNIELTIKGVYSNKDELYFVFNLKNNGGQPFDIKTWSLYRSSDKLAKKLAKGKLRGKELVQPMFYDPELEYNLNNRVEPTSEMDFTIVVTKFTIGKDKAVYLDIDELNGERDIYMPLYYKRINYPINYNFNNNK